MDGWMDRGLEGWRNGGEIGKGRVVVVARTAVDDDDMGVLCNEGSVAAGRRYLPPCLASVSGGLVVRAAPGPVPCDLGAAQWRGQQTSRTQDCEMPSQSRTRQQGNRYQPGEWCDSRGSSETEAEAEAEAEEEKKNLCWRRDTLTL